MNLKTKRYVFKELNNIIKKSEDLYFEERKDEIDES